MGALEFTVHLQFFVADVGKVLHAEPGSDRDGERSRREVMPKRIYFILKRFFHKRENTLNNPLGATVLTQEVVLRYGPLLLLVLLLVPTGSGGNRRRWKPPKPKALKCDFQIKVFSKIKRNSVCEIPKYGSLMSILCTNPRCAPPPFDTLFASPTRCQLPLPLQFDVRPLV